MRQKQGSVDRNMRLLQGTTAIKRAQTDPVWFVRLITTSKPWAKQEEILRSVWANKWTLVKSCHGAGKSWVSAHAALAFLYSHPYSIVPTTAPTFRQVEKILWEELRRAWRMSPLPLGGDLPPKAPELKLADKWFAYGFSADNADAAQGIHADHVLMVVDEACGVEPEIWDAVSANLSTGHARGLLIGNPTDPASCFAEYAERPDVNVIKITAFDTPNFTHFGITLADIRSGAWRDKIVGPLPAPWLTTPEWVAEVHVQGEDSPFWRARVMAEFPDQGEDTLIALSWIEAAAEREKTPGKGKKAIAVDVARFGSDRTVIMGREGGNVSVLESYQGKDTQFTARRALFHRVSFGADTVAVDADGLGAGVVDAAREMAGRNRYCVLEIHGGGEPFDKDRFVNKRAEMFWELRERFRVGDITIPKDKRIMGELSKLRYYIDSKGRIGMESKDDMKKRGLHSPDHADCLAYLFAETKGGIESYIRAVQAG